MLDLRQCALGEPEDGIALADLFLDKGLVTYDRQTRKDAWYWYQANWSSTPMVHLAADESRYR